MLPPHLKLNSLRQMVACLNGAQIVTYRARFRQQFSGAVQTLFCESFSLQGFL